MNQMEKVVVILPLITMFLSTGYSFSNWKQLAKQLAEICFIAGVEKAATCSLQ